MCDIDWNKLYEATSKENRPTPGYLFNDIVQNVSYADPKHIPSVAEYLTECVDGDHAHVKLKALFVIKALAYRVPPFCRCMQESLSSVQEAAAFTGPPSALYGEEPYRLVREAAEGALTALTGGEHYHEQYREMSQRIVGFGNYLPGEDTVLPDGSVNVGRDIGVKDVAWGAVGLVGAGVGAIFGGVKDLFYSPFNQKKGSLGALGTEEEEEDPEVDVGYDDDPVAPEEEEEPQGTTDEAGCYHASAGSYIPPCVPLAPPPEQEPTGADSPPPDIFDDGEQTYWPAEDLLGGSPEDPARASSAQGAETAFMDVLGLDDSADTAGPEATSGARRGEPESLEPSEAEILDILGITGGGGGSFAAAGLGEGALLEAAPLEPAPAVAAPAASSAFASSVAVAEGGPDPAVAQPSLSLPSPPQAQPVAILGDGFMEV